MKSSSEPPKRITVRGTLRGLLRDIFFGGSEYKTVRGEATPFPTAVLIGAVVATLLFLLLVFSWIDVSEMKYDIAQDKKELSSLEAQKEKLENELNRLYPLPVIESGAAELGLSADFGETIPLEDE